MYSLLLFFNNSIASFCKSGSFLNSSVIKSIISEEATEIPTVFGPIAGIFFELTNQARPAGFDKIFAAILYLTIDKADPNLRFNKLFKILPDIKPPADAATSEVTRRAA